MIRFIRSLLGAITPAYGEQCADTDGLAAERDGMVWRGGDMSGRPTLVPMSAGAVGCGG